MKWRSALLLLLACVLTGCARNDSTSRRYDTRGVVKHFARPDGAELVLIHHEPIADYVGRDGRAKAMPSMTMVFRVSSSVPVEGVRLGDKVEITVASDWSRYPVHTIERLRRLPAETALSLEDQ